MLVAQGALTLALVAWTVALALVARWDRANSPATRRVRFECERGEVRARLRGSIAQFGDHAWGLVVSQQGFTAGGYTGLGRIDLRSARATLRWNGLTRPGTDTMREGPRGDLAEIVPQMNLPEEVTLYHAGGGASVVAFCNPVFAMAWVGDALEVVCGLAPQYRRATDAERFVIRVGEHRARPVTDRLVRAFPQRPQESAAWHDDAGWHFASSRTSARADGTWFEVYEWQEGTEPRPVLQVPAERAWAAATTEPLTRFASAARVCWPWDTLGRTPCAHRDAAGAWTLGVPQPRAQRPVPDPTYQRMEVSTGDAAAGVRRQIAYGEAGRWTLPDGAEVTTVVSSRGVSLCRSGRCTGSIVGSESFGREIHALLPDGRGAWILAQGADGVRLAHVNGELQRDDVPSLLARLRDAPESWFERVGQGQRAPATALLALRRVVLPWILAGLPVALALATLLWLARGGRPRRRWVTHAAWLAALWLATSAALAPAFLPMVQVR